MKALYCYETSETGKDTAPCPWRSESSATRLLLFYVACGYHCCRGYLIYQILTVATVVLFINFTGLPLVCLTTFAVIIIIIIIIIIISLVNKVKIHFLVVLFAVVNLMLWIIRSPQNYFAYDQILVLEYFKLMWIITSFIYPTESTTRLF